MATTAKGKSDKEPKKKGRSIYLDEKVDKILVKSANDSGKSIGTYVTELLEEKESELNEKDSKLPQIIVFSNFKGGVAKTFSVREVAYLLGSMGMSVLLIDLDGQSNLSSSFQVYDPRELPGYISDVILADPEGNRKTLDEVIIHTEWDNVDLVAANLTFAAADNKIRSQEGGAIDRRLYYAIQDLIKEHLFDYILIDCPPTADSVVQNAILALQAGNRHSMVIIPVDPDVQAIDGMQITLQLVDTISQDNRLPKPRVMMLWTRAVERSVLFKELYAEMSETLTVPVFKTIIPSSTKVGESRGVFKPINVFAKTTRTATRYRELVDEILSMRKDS